MYSNNSNGSRAASARGFVALCAVLAMGLGLMAQPAAAAPFAYVANIDSNTVSVIDTGTNPPSVVATVPVGPAPNAVAVTPDGKHAYVAGENVSVVDTTTNTVVATIAASGEGIAISPDGKTVYVTSLTFFVTVIDTTTNTVVATIHSIGPTSFPNGVAFTPDGQRAYVANSFGSGTSTVSVIATATNTVVATVPVGSGTGSFADGVAVTPDGKHVYVTNSKNSGDGTVSVIDTATNTVVATVPVGSGPFGIAFAPDGKQAYVVDEFSGTVSVIATASNTVAATVPVGSGPTWVAVTPDGKRAYVTNTGTGSVPGTVSVIDTATNTVEAATIMVGKGPEGVGIVPPPVGVPFLAFNALLAIPPSLNAFRLESSFTLGSTAPAINPVTQAVALQVGTFTTTIPPGSFKNVGGKFPFVGVIGGVTLQVLIAPTGTLRYGFFAGASGASLAGTTSPVPVTLTIGNDTGTTSVNALIFH